MDNNEITPFDTAIMSALMSVIEVLAAKGVATHQEFAIPFRQQMEDSMKSGNGHGAAIFQMLLEFCQRHGSAHALRNAEPGGSA